MGTIQAVAKASYSNFNLQEGADPKNPLVVQFAFRFAEANSARSADLCFILDRSGSMAQEAGGAWPPGTTRWDALRATLRALVSKLNADDRVGMVLFDHEAIVIGGGLVPSRDLAALVGAMPSLPRGSTDIGAGLSVALGTMNARRADKPGVLLLLSDGHTTSNPAVDKAPAMVELAAKANLDLVTLGIGTDWNVEYLNSLARGLGGRAPTFLDGTQCALDALDGIARSARDTVLKGARLEGFLNGALCSVGVVRHLQPSKSGPCKTRIVAGRAGLSNHPLLTNKWVHSLGNLRAGQDYSLVLEIPHLPAPPVGTHELGRFWLSDSQGRQLTSPDAMAVDLVVSKEKFSDHRTSPGNADREVLRAWEEARIPEFQEALRQAVEGGNPGQIATRWEAIIETLKFVEGENGDGLKLERARYAEWCASKGFNRLSDLRTDAVTSRPTSRTARTTKTVLNQAPSISFDGDYPTDQNIPKTIPGGPTFPGTIPSPVAPGSDPKRRRRG